MTPLPNPEAREKAWPADQFFWAVLDAPGVRAAGILPQGLSPSLQEELPVSVDEVHAVAAAAGDGKILVCAAKRSALRELPPTILRLRPENMPPEVEPKVNGDFFNLLVGDFEPAPLRRERSRRRALMGAAAAALAGLLAVGLARRAEVWTSAGTNARTEVAILTSSFGSGPIAMQVELERLRKAPRAQSKSIASPDAAVALAALLSEWPRELECQTESVSVTPATMTLSLTVAKDARPFLSALKPPEGWTLDEPRLSATADGARLHLVLHRREAKS